MKRFGALLASAALARRWPRAVPPSHSMAAVVAAIWVGSAAANLASLAAGASEWAALIAASAFAASALIAASITASPGLIVSTISTVSTISITAFSVTALFFPFVWGGWGYGYPYADCGNWGNWGNPYCGYGYSSYGYGYPDYAYSYPDYGYAYDYGYPASGSSGYYAAAPHVTGRSVATGQLGGYCTISVKACERNHGACSCRVPGGRPPGAVAY